MVRRQGLNSFFVCVYTMVPNICWKDKTPLAFAKNHFAINVSVYFWILFSSIDLYVFSHANTMLSGFLGFYSKF